MTQAVITIYLRNGCSFALRPSAPELKPPHDSDIEKMMSDPRAIMALSQATPRVVIRWSEVVAVMVTDEVIDAGGNYA